MTQRGARPDGSPSAGCARRARPTPRPRLALRGRPAGRRLGSASTRERDRMLGPAARPRARRLDARPAAAATSRARDRTATPGTRRVIADARNDDNLAVAQTHVAFIRFHNRVVEHETTRDAPAGERLTLARGGIVTRHFQWMVWFDFLPRICDPDVLDDVWRDGRKAFEPGVGPRRRRRRCRSSSPSACSALGHSMVRSHVRLEPLRRPTPPRPVRPLRPRRRPRRDARGCGAPASPTSGGSTTSASGPAASRPGERNAGARASTRGSRTGCATCPPGTFDGERRRRREDARAEPRVPQPDEGPRASGSRPGRTMAAFLSAPRRRPWGR